MHLHREMILHLSGMRRTMLKCHSGHFFHLLEGVPVEAGDCRKVECALNANAANSEVTQRWLSRVSRHVTRTQHTESEPFSLHTPATVLNLQLWGLQMHAELGLPKKGAEALTTMRNSSAASRSENTRHYAAAVAEREAA